VHAASAARLPTAAMRTPDAASAFEAMAGIVHQTARAMPPGTSHSRHSMNAIEP
jgi:hypothetical protein